MKRPYFFMCLFVLFTGSYVVQAQQALSVYNNPKPSFNLSDSQISDNSYFELPITIGHSDWEGPMLVGLLGGAIGFAAGGGLGYFLDSRSCGEDEWFCGIGGVVIGGLIGESFGIPLGVHLGNKQQGDFGKELLISYGIAGAGLGLSLATDSPIVVAVPFVQLAVTLTIEI